MNKNLKTYSGLDAHIHYSNGEAKTVCTSAVLGALGISPGQYRYSGRVRQWPPILRRAGYAVRSRNVQARGVGTVGALRRLIKSRRRAWGDPGRAWYLVTVKSRTAWHLILLDSNGKTVVDTAPRKRDRRPVVDVQAAWLR